MTDNDAHSVYISLRLDNIDDNAFARTYTHHLSLVLIDRYRRVCYR